MSDRLGFAATSAYGAECLRRVVAAGASIGVVLTQPDRPAGRRRRPTPPPAALAAHDLGLPVLQPERAADALPDLQAAGVAAMGICAYGQLLPDALLAAFPWVNLHPSALPRWRGAAPVERAILAGDTSTATAVMAVVAELDAGPVAAVVPFDIGPRDNAGDVMERSLELGVVPLADALTAAAAGSLVTTPQAADGVVYAHKLSAADRLLDPQGPVDEADRRIRALAPHIGAALLLAGERCTVWRAAPAPDRVGSGEVAAADGRLLIGFADGALEVESIRPAGKRTMSAGELLRGWRGPLGPATRAG
ncbi:MAG: methionyl-tRNA formyltransferase [Gaiellaceae bacterium]|nr:methionyl-tRNA formyltransferase [Gaiellaceae bacterium]